MRIGAWDTGNGETGGRGEKRRGSDENKKTVGRIVPHGGLGDSSMWCSHVRIVSFKGENLLKWNVIYENMIGKVRRTLKKAVGPCGRWETSSPLQTLLFSLRMKMCVKPLAPACAHMSFTCSTTMAKGDSV
jgi:hypothetical protein